MEVERARVEEPPVGMVGLFLKRLRKPAYVGEYMVVAGLALLSVFLFLALFPDLVAPYDPIAIGLGPRLAPPNSQFIMGTDHLGRDVLSRVIWGARIALLVSTSAAVLSLVIGAPLGLVSGFLGGKLDRVLSLVMDSIYAFPSLVLAIAIAAVLGPGIANVAIAISVIYIPTYFRVVRGEVLVIREQLYVEAARAIGAKSPTIMRKYVLPNALPSMIVVFTLNVADAVLTEAGLSFLGLGIPPPTPDWGQDLQRGLEVVLSGSWHPIFFPGIMIVLLVLAFCLIGDGLGEVLNPRLREP